MKRTFDHPHKLTLTVRTESGTASIDIGIEWLTRLERKFLHQLIKGTEKGGTIGFGVEPGEEAGSNVIKLTLLQKAQESANGAAA